MNEIKIAAIQMVSTAQVQQNIENAKLIIKEAKLNGAQAVVLPEYWSIMGMSDQDKISIAEEFGNGILQDSLKQLAIDNQLIIFAGTIPLKSTIANKIYNSLLIFNSQGQCIYRYDKIHLFDYNGISENFKESDTIIAGNNIPNFKLYGFKFALGICYDLRFPEFFRQQGIFDILILVAAFTFNTGKVHWTTLLKARAIENQCYVVSSAQGGIHQNGRRTYGHSMIIDPWGKILTKINENSGFIIHKITKRKIDIIRNDLPAIYNKILK